MYRIFNKISLIFKPLVKKKIIPEGEYSPHLHFVDRNVVKEYIENYARSVKGGKKLLDIGGRHGEYNKYAKDFEYQILEIDTEARGPNLIIGDICNCPEIKDEQYDIIFSNNVLEHVKEPWKAAEECVRLVKKGGLIIHLVPFGARYHPVPVDCYRYTHYGLQYLFERTTHVETLLSAYDITNRRADKRGGKIKGNLDLCPVDKLGGWIENWHVVYIGKKTT